MLKGGSEFATDLTRTLRKLHTYRFDGSATGSAALPQPALPFTVDYVRVKSYEGTESSGNVKISGIDMKTLAGRDIIVVEDIIDTGLTMTRLLPELGRYGIKSVRVAALLEKRTHKSCGFKADFVGFSVPDAFVVRDRSPRARHHDTDAASKRIAMLTPSHSPFCSLVRLATIWISMRHSAKCRTFASFQRKASSISRATPC